MTDISTTPVSVPLRRKHPVPAEGDDGLYSVTWYPICLSSELGPESVVGRPFLGGRVVAFRGRDGIAQVTSAYCPHLGADLGLGAVVDGHLRCAFHHFEFATDGRCVRTGCGDPPPSAARLFAFATRERYGIVWAFNGIEADWELPELDPPVDGWATVNFPPTELAADPWSIISNTTDFQHFRFVHGFDTTRDSFEWFDNVVSMELKARLPDHQNGSEVHYRVRHHGTNLSLISGTVDRHELRILIAFAIPCPGVSEVFTMLATRPGDGPVDVPSAALDQIADVFGVMGGEDNPLLESAHFMPGTLTPHDRQLARFLQFVRRFPRANPAADFIN